MHSPAMLTEFAAFLNEREQIRLRKERGDPWPWTKDPILQAYRFTNIKRFHDKTTQYFYKSCYQPNRSRPAGEILFNCALLRFFGTIEFANEFGWMYRWNPDKVAARAMKLMANHKKLFTAAYIISSGGVKAAKPITVCKWLTPIWNDREFLARIAANTNSWRETALAMRAYKGFGWFMIKEVLQDAILTPALEHAYDRDSWTPIGPGARRGLNRVYKRSITANRTQNEFLLEILEIRHNLSQHDMLATYMPELGAHDIQFQLCEFDKYLRVKLGQGRPKARYKAPGFL